VTIDIDLPFAPRDAVVIAAFEGWNDAANASTAALDHLIDVFDAEFVGEIDPDEFYDFQVNRPMVGFVSDPDADDDDSDDDGPTPDTVVDGSADGTRTATAGDADTDQSDDTDADDVGLPARTLTWPTTRIYLARPDGFDRDLVFVRGIEPNMRWRAFTAELLAAGDTLGAQMWIVLGALLADVPHTRPIPVNGNSSDPSVVAGHSVEPSRYEGPTGINGIITDACARVEIPAVSYWAAVPHYVSQPPCPKASLALLRAVEDLLGLTIPLGDLPESARAWERGVAELAAGDEEIAEYVAQLEQARDATDLPQASGEAIAAEFESYLRRQDRHRGVRGEGPSDDEIPND
jgi:PAC2 family